MTQSASGGLDPTGPQQLPGSDFGAHQHAQPNPFQAQYPPQAQYAPNQPNPQIGHMPQYGHTVQQVVVQQRPGNGVGVAGFITGLLGLIFCWVPGLGIVLAVLGVILGGAGMASGRKSGAGTGLAIAGLVLGIVALIPAIIIIAAVSSVNGTT